MLADCLRRPGMPLRVHDRRGDGRRRGLGEKHAGDPRDDGVEVAPGLQRDGRSAERSRLQQGQPEILEAGGHQRGAVGIDPAQLLVGEPLAQAHIGGEGSGEPGRPRTVADDDEPAGRHPGEGGDHPVDVRVGQHP